MKLLFQLILTFILLFLSQNIWAIETSGGNATMFTISNGSRIWKKRTVDAINGTNKNLPAGTVVKIKGASNGKYIVEPISSVYFPDKCIGFVKENSIAKNDCIVQVEGIVKGLNTAGYEEDQEVFISEILGEWSSNKPQKGSIVSLGTIQKVDSIDGWIAIKTFLK